MTGRLYGERANKLKSPRKGTKTRALLNACIKGITNEEAAKAGLVKSTVGAALERLRDQYGYDVRAFPFRPARPGGKMKGLRTYKKYLLVGVYTKTGYRKIRYLNG